MSKVIDIKRNKSAREMKAMLKDLIDQIPDDDMKSFIIAVKTDKNFGFACGNPDLELLGFIDGHTYLLRGEIVFDWLEEHGDLE